MAYETKVLLIAIGNILKNAKNIEEAYRIVAEMANAEGVILKPFDEKENE